MSVNFFIKNPEKNIALSSPDPKSIPLKNLFPGILAQ
jgi:hypothetical protein